MAKNKMQKKRSRIASDLLTHHFFLYIVYLKRAFDNINRPLDKILTQAWINKILEDPHPSHLNAFKRNTYLAQLLINLYDGKLQSPFTRMPTSSPLEFLDELSDQPVKKQTENNTSTVCETFNKELPLDELNHTSSDERTYIAIRSLDNGNVLFGYVAVSVGYVGADSVWINSKGETVKRPTPSFKDIPVNSTVSTEGAELSLDEQTNKGLNCLVAGVWNVLSQRQTPETRERAGDFYRMLYCNIEQEMLSERNTKSSKCRDPYIEKLIDFLINDLTADGIREPETFHRLNLLSMLKKRIKVVIKEIESRQDILVKVKNKTTMPLMELYQHPSSNSLSFVSVMTLQEALEGTMNTKTIDLLFMQYPSSVVQEFKKVIIHEKIRAMRLVKIRLDNVTGEMFKDLKDVITRGLRDYQAAKEEWLRAWRVFKEYEEVSKLVAKLTSTGNNENNDDKFLETIQDEINLAQKRLKTANEKTVKLEKEINSLHKKVHELNEKYELEKKHVEKQRDTLKEEIANETMATQQREATIEHLANMADDIKTNNNKQH